VTLVVSIIGTDRDAGFAAIVSTAGVGNRSGNNGRAATARAGVNCIERPVFSGLARGCRAS